MKFVIDTNILLSALIKDSATRMIILDSNWVFYYPEISLQEVRRYKETVVKKSGLTEQEYQAILNRLLRNMSLVSKERIKPEDQLLQTFEEFKKLEKTQFGSKPGEMQLHKVSQMADLSLSNNGDLQALQKSIYQLLEKHQ